MNLWASDQKTLVFNRVGYLALFIVFLMSSANADFAQEKLGLEGMFFFPLDILVIPVAMTSLVQTLPFSKRLSDVTPNATLWYNATYMVALSVSVLWVAQLSVLVYGFRYWHRVDFWEVILRNVILLFWAVVAIAVCRAVLGQVIQIKQTHFGKKSS